MRARLKMCTCPLYFFLWVNFVWFDLAVCVAVAVARGVWGADRSQSVAGAVDDVARSCPHLTKLRLSGMGASCTGTLASVGAACPNLRELHLADTQVRGKLGDVARLHLLESLCLEGCAEGVTGDLASLATLPRLREARLQQTRVEGDLACLGGLAKLTELRVHGTYVRGQLWEALGALSDLTVREEKEAEREIIVKKEPNNQQV